MICVFEWDVRAYNDRPRRETRRKSAAIVKTRRQRRKEKRGIKTCMGRCGRIAPDILREIHNPWATSPRFLTFSQLGDKIIPEKPGRGESRRANRSKGAVGDVTQASIPKDGRMKRGEA